MWVRIPPSAPPGKYPTSVAAALATNGCTCDEDVLPLVAYERTKQTLPSTGDVTTVANYQIEREVEIDAPLDVVWRTITEPEQISQ